ncbi:OsmC family protein [soil metagenome]
MTGSIEYQGNLRCSITHMQSGTIIETDAPTDNRGNGERFSPTDTVCVGLATCIITTMGIKAQDLNVELKGASLEVTKHMFSEPRRIGKIDVVLNLPGSIDEKNRIILERVGDTCPVKKSLHPELEVNVKYVWG